MAPLQQGWVQNRLALPAGELMKEIRVLTLEGRVLGGADGIVELARHIWFAWPILLFSRIPGALPIMRATYRRIAAARYCVGGRCSVLSTGKASDIRPQASEKLAHSKSRADSWSAALVDWLPLILLPSFTFVFRERLPAWIFMWVMTSSIFTGCKWLTWRRACRAGAKPPLVRSLGYLLAWPGMDAGSFLKVREFRQQISIPYGPLFLAVGNTLTGAGLIWFGAFRPSAGLSLLTGWIGMIGLVLVLHFGVFQLLALAWQRAGVNAQPVMRSPILATSLTEFWGERWNTAFNVLAHDFVFRPLARRWGATVGTLAAFFISGLIHELVISVPARAGYGLPTTYFMLQSLGVLAQRSRRGRRVGVGSGLRGWFWTLAFAGLPAFWLFHPPFVRNVILPMLNVIGAL